MFENLRQSLRDAMSRASSPDETRAVLSMMRDALVEAKVAVASLRAELEETRARLVRERNELATVQRRGRMASEIGDEETVRVATQYEKKHGERIVVLERKLQAQEAELTLAEQEMTEMRLQMKSAGIAAPDLSAASSMPPVDPADELRRTVDRAAREAEAERKLAELKRRMSK
jgi:hypothetical protein